MPARASSLDNSVRARARLYCSKNPARTKHQFEYDPFAPLYNGQGDGYDPFKDAWSRGEARRPAPSAEGAPPYWRDAFRRLGRG